MARKLQFYFEQPHTEWFLCHFFKAVSDSLVEDNKDIEFEFFNSGSLSPNSRDPNTINSAHMMTIKNPENNKYIVTSFWDKNIILFNKHIWDIDNCVQVITSSGLNRQEFENNKTHRDPHMVYPDFDYIYTPFTYNVYSLRVARLIEEVFSNRSYDNLKNETVFRGYLYMERKFLNDVFTNNEQIKVLDRIEDVDYLIEQTNNICALSLNGAGEICNRDIELFGIGMPVMRLDLNVEFQNKLIPDYHYISLGKCGFEHSRTLIDYNELKDRIVEKYNYILKNKEEATQIGQNARKWYLENCTLDSMVKLFKSIVKLERLFE